MYEKYKKETYFYSPFSSLIFPVTATVQNKEYLYEYKCLKTKLWQVNFSFGRNK